MMMMLVDADEVDDDEDDDDNDDELWGLQLHCRGYGHASCCANCKKAEECGALIYCWTIGVYSWSSIGGPDGFHRGFIL